MAGLCAEGMVPFLPEAQAPAAPLPGGAEPAAAAAINPPAGVRVAGILMIPVVGGKYKDSCNGDGSIVEALESKHRPGSGLPAQLDCSGISRTAAWFASIPRFRQGSRAQRDAA